MVVVDSTLKPSTPQGLADRERDLKVAHAYTEIELHGENEHGDAI
jgi:hypothetical protein